MEKLKPCPFCGKKNFSEKEKIINQELGFRLGCSICGENLYRIYCYYCGAKGSRKNTLIRAIQAWNKRSG